MTAAQIKEVGLFQAPGEVSSLIKDELPAFSPLLLSCDSKETGIAQNALARVKEMLYDSIINPWALILPNINLISNSLNQEPPVQKKNRGSNQRSSNKAKKSKATLKSVAGILDDDHSSEEGKKEELDLTAADDETVVDPASVPFFQSFTSSFSDASDESDFKRYSFLAS